MKSFLGLFGQKRDPLGQQASRLVSAARVNATAMYLPLLDQFDCLRPVSTENWDFIVTVAGVFVGITRLRNLNLGQTQEERLTKEIVRQLAEWSPGNGVRAFADCKLLFERVYDSLKRTNDDPRFLAADAVGTWITWNTIGKAPTDNSSRTLQERQFIRSVGALITHAFFDWWN